MDADRSECESTNSSLEVEHSDSQSSNSGYWLTTDEYYNGSATANEMENTHTHNQNNNINHNSNNVTDESSSDNSLSGVTIEEEENEFDFIEIDGSYLEGGGQIIRNSMAYAAILRVPIHIFNIRAGRSISGLRDQHSSGISLISQICAKSNPCQYLHGNYVSSPALRFFVGEREQERGSASNSSNCDYLLDSGSKASIALMIQTCLPVLLFCSTPKQVTIIGGTNASQFAPHIDYMIHVLQPTLLRLMGIRIEIECQKRGYLPNGGGICTLKTLPIKGYLPCFDLTDRGSQLSKIRGVCVLHARNTKQNDAQIQIESRAICDRIISSIKNKITDTDINIEIEIEIDIDDEVEVDDIDRRTEIVIELYVETTSKCIFGVSNMARIAIETENSDAMDIHIEDMSTKVCAEVHQLISDTNDNCLSCTDKHLQDQLIIFMALAKGTSRMIIGSYEKHTQTAIHFAQLITGAEFDVRKCNNNGSGSGSDNEDGCLLIECQGIAVENENQSK